jgi:hypothetical protein
MTPAEAAWLLEEWARWQRGDAVNIGFPHATPFGRLIKPDPSPARFPVDPDRALETDRVIAKLPQRYRFLIRMHWLDSAPIDSKARRIRLGRKAYLLLVKGLCGVVAQRLASERRSVINRA